MGASSSGLLDEAKTSHIEGLVDNSLRSFSTFYRQQYPAAYFRHLLQEVEPKKLERGLLLTQRPRPDPEEVLYEGKVRFSSWDDQTKKGKDRYVVLKRSHNLEIHENQETFLQGMAPKHLLQPVGCTALTSVAEAQAVLDQVCAGILNGVKEDSSPAASPPEGFPVHLHQPHTGLYCFLFQHDHERHHFLSALNTCIRHHNLDPWSDASFESQAFVHALQLYRRDKGCYECWEMLLGSEEQVLAAQLMEEVSPWLQSQLQHKLKGKKMERIRLWFATLHAAHALVFEKLKPDLEALREECRGSASADQGLIRSSLDQITASQSFLLDKIRGCVSEAAEGALDDFISPYMPSVLEALTENIGPALEEMRQILQEEIDFALAEKGGSSEVIKRVSSLTKTGVEKCYQQVEKLKEDFSKLRGRFELSSTVRLVHSAHLDMEKLLDSAVYTFDLFLRTSARLQLDQYRVRIKRAKERVLKQLDYDSRLVQGRLYEEALLQIALPTLTRRVDSACKNELQPFEQYIFSDFSSFILVQNVYQDVLREILNSEIQKVLREAESTGGSSFLTDASDFALSQYSLLAQIPTSSVPNSPALRPREIPPTVSTQDSDPVKGKGPTSEAGCLNINVNEVNDIVPPVIVVTQEITDASTEESLGVQSDPMTDLIQYESSDSESVKIWEETSDSDPLEVLESLTSFEDALEEMPQSSSLEKINTNVQDLDCNLPANSNVCQNNTASQTSQATNPMKISLDTLSEAVVSNATEKIMHQSKDKAVYFKGPIMENWQFEKQKGENKTEILVLQDETVHSNTDQKDSEEIMTDEKNMDSLSVNIPKNEAVNINAISEKEREMQMEDNEHPALDSVAAIRDLVTDVSEVELTIKPCSSDTDSSNLLEIK